MTEAENIQLMLPAEPDWSQVRNDVLIDLVKNYVFEQSCATSALCILASRNHPRLKELAEWLIAEKDADKWLKACATERLADD